MFPESVAQPRVERHLLAIASAHEVRLAGKQALRRSQPDKILRRFDLRFEMYVLTRTCPAASCGVCACPLRMKVASVVSILRRRKAIVCSSDSAARAGTALQIANKTKTPTNQLRILLNRAP